MKAEKTINPMVETINDFMFKLSRTPKGAWVETTPEIIAYHNRGGMNGRPYYNHGGVFVCEYGKIEECLKIIEADQNTMTHGADEGRNMHSA